MMDKNPTRIGQRVMDLYAGTRGWVIGFEGNDTLVNWDEPDQPGTMDTGKFPTEDLEVVEVIVLDADHYRDPALSPLVEQSRSGGAETVYIFTDGTQARGIQNARLRLIDLVTGDRA